MKQWILKLAFGLALCGLLLAFIHLAEVMGMEHAPFVFFIILGWFVIAWCFNQLQKIKNPKLRYNFDYFTIQTITILDALLAYGLWYICGKYLGINL